MGCKEIACEENAYLPAHSPAQIFRKTQACRNTYQATRYMHAYARMYIHTRICAKACTHTLEVLIFNIAFQVKDVP